MTIALSNTFRGYSQIPFKALSNTPLNTFRGYSQIPFKYPIGLSNSNSHFIKLFKSLYQSLLITLSLTVILSSSIYSHSYPFPITTIKATIQPPIQIKLSNTL